MRCAKHLSLSPNQVLAVNAEQIVVESGILWLTQSGCPDDVILVGGQSFCPHRSGKVVIQALHEEARLSLQSSSIAARLRALFFSLSNARFFKRRRLQSHSYDKAGGLAQYTLTNIRTEEPA